MSRRIGRRTVGVVQFHDATVALDDLPGYGQPEPGSAGRLSPGAVDPDESLEDAVGVCLGMPGPSSSTVKNGLAVDFRQRERDGTARRDVRRCRSGF